MADADDGEHLARGLEVLPRRRHAASEDELEVEASGVPGLVREGALLVLLVVGAERGEVDARVVRHQRRVVAQAWRRDRAADGEHRDADGRPGLDAQPGLHGRRVDLSGSLVPDGAGARQVETNALRSEGARLRDLIRRTIWHVVGLVLDQAMIHKSDPICFL
jgi:hypothetical protein